jgi:hypothetical protein
MIDLLALILLVDSSEGRFRFDDGDPPSCEKEVTLTDGRFRALTLMEHGTFRRPDTPPSLLCSFSEALEEDLTTFVFDYDPESATWRFTPSKTSGPREESVAQRFSLGSRGRDQLSSTELAQFAREFLADDQ